ncbi:hypothetical protein CU097_003571 [Rhizopus azygosporus]|uniref:Uncharacterized protein n=1 Tax=Rhizopus azygosporus TaxID=86630 RepID=A0A367IR00_RHIAZ|nr:hypothetical protein CU097_003571 [Rhizopus azygosporus]
MRPIYYILTFFIVLCAISVVNASNNLERKHITRSIPSDSSSSSKTTSKTEPIFALVVVIALGSLMF